MDAFLLLQNRAKLLAEVIFGTVWRHFDALFFVFLIGGYRFGMDVGFRWKVATTYSKAGDASISKMMI